MYANPAQANFRFAAHRKEGIAGTGVVVPPVAGPFAPCYNAGWLDEPSVAAASHGQAVATAPPHWVAPLFNPAPVLLPMLTPGVPAWPERGIWPGATPEERAAWRGITNWA